jgi:hypothetical protein
MQPKLKLRKPPTGNRWKASNGLFGYPARVNFSDTALISLIGGTDAVRFWKLITRHGENQRFTVL